MQKRTKRAKVVKSLASLVSFERFVNIGVSTQKVVLGKERKREKGGPTVKRVVGERPIYAP